MSSRRLGNAADNFNTQVSKRMQSVSVVAMVYNRTDSLNNWRKQHTLTVSF